MVAYLRDREAIVYAHNGGRFDYHYLRPYINLDEPFMVINGRIAKFKIGKCEFRDSMNLLNEPLKRFAKEKVDYSLFESEVRDLPQNRKIISDYLRSDCVNLYNVIAAFEKDYGRNLTQAGAAMRYWQREFKVQAPRQSVFRFKEMKPYYYGGRVQCFESGHAQTDFSVVDINSAYPYAMLFKHPFATGATSKLGLPRDNALGQTLVRLDAISKGALPLRAADGSLFFPDDEREVREYHVTGWEIAAGLETNTLKIVKIRECLTFAELIDFRDYIYHFFDKRKKAKAEGDNFRDLFAKRFMNALYGKFASDPENYSEQVLASAEKLPEWIAKGFEANTTWEHSTFMQRQLPTDKHRYYNVATAASITGFVRAHLWKAIQNSGQVIYCDTDSVAARDVSRLELGPELGQWKKELDCDEYAIAGKKTYAFHARNMPREDNSDIDDEKIPKNWKKASKGVKLNVSDIVKIASGEKFEYSPDVPTYSVHKAAPVFVPREIRNTVKDIRIMGRVA